MFATLINHCGAKRRVHCENQQKMVRIYLPVIWSFLTKSLADTFRAKMMQIQTTITQMLGGGAVPSAVPWLKRVPVQMLGGSAVPTAVPWLKRVPVQMLCGGAVPTAVLL